MRTIYRCKPCALLILALIFVISISCNLPVQFWSADKGGDNQDDVQPQSAQAIVLKTDEMTLLEQDVVIPPGGGTLRIDRPGTPLHGLEITVPGGAWSDSVALTIRSADITSHNLAQGVRVASPLIAVETTFQDPAGEEYADEFIALSLPLDKPADTFAMFFIYDEVTGTLDALPLRSQDDGQLTALTRHFSKLVILESDKAELDKLNIKTNFVQGVNNWQFTNRGSYIAPDGHCAGQIMTAMYYYDLTGGEPLYGVYDATNNRHEPTPNLDWDDRLGYRLASVAQVKANWDNQIKKYWDQLQRLDAETTYYSFALALRASNAPQYVSVRREGGGHALILYEKYGDRLYVSDPNHPGPSDRRAIVYDRTNKSFRPYFGGATADAARVAYPNTYYVNKTWLVSPLQFDAMWAEFTSGTIGDNYFPAYYLWHRPEVAGIDPLQTIIKDPYFVTTQWVDVMLVPKDGLNARMRVYNPDLSIRFRGIPGRQSVRLPVGAGTAQYLFVISAEIDGEQHYVDGRWITFVQNYTGSWSSGPVCDELNETRFRWQVSLIQEGEEHVRGTIRFHDCPGGGQSVYDVSGRLRPNQDALTLEGVKSGGAGKLRENTPDNQTFTFRPGQPPQPNFAP